jgi:hypothetical protein
VGVGLGGHLEGKGGQYWRFYMIERTLFGIARTTLGGRGMRGHLEGKRGQYWRFYMIERTLLGIARNSPV